MPEAPLTFLGIPEDDLLEVMKRADAVTILRLRKVCQLLRNLIDDKRPDLRAQSIKIKFLHCSIYVTYVTGPDEEHEIVYSQDVKDSGRPLKNSTVERGGIQKQFKNQKNYNLFFADLAIWLKQQRTKWNKIEVVYGDKKDIWKHEDKIRKLAETLDRNGPIETSEIIMRVNLAYEIIGILPTLHSQKLDKITIGYYEGFNEEETNEDSSSEDSEDSDGDPVLPKMVMDLSDLEQWEQWRTVKQVDMDFCVTMEDIHRFDKFEKASFAVKASSSKLTELEQIHIASPKTEFIYFYPSDDDHLPDGDNFFIDNRGSVNYLYRIPEKEEFLLLLRPESVHDLFIIQRIPKSDVPQEVQTRFVNELKFNNL